MNNDYTHILILTADNDIEHYKLTTQEMFIIKECFELYYLSDYYKSYEIIDINIPPYDTINLDTVMSYDDIDKDMIFNL